MATVEEGLQAQIRNIEATYGKPIREWLAIIAASGLTKHTDIVNMLKNDYGMTHGAAHRVSILARQNAAQQTGADQDSDPVSALYTGKKASLRPIHDALMSAIHGFGDDIELAPKKGYVSLRRRKQFAMIQPSGAGRIDLGLILPDVPADAPRIRRRIQRPVHPPSPPVQHSRHQHGTDRLAQARLRPRITSNDAGCSADRHPIQPAKPKLRPVRQAIPGLTWCFAGSAEWRSGYFKVSGIGAPRSSKACRWALVGSASIAMVTWVPVYRTWLRVKVARCSSRPRKLR